MLIRISNCIVPYDSETGYFTSKIKGASGILDNWSMWVIKVYYGYNTNVGCHGK